MPKVAAKNTMWVLIRHPKKPNGKSCVDVVRVMGMECT
jgi:hypothetical protein